MKTLMKHSMEENGEHRKFGCLPDVLSNSPCQLGALVSKSFSERTISVVNLLVHAHRARLDHDNIDNMVILHMSKKPIERVRQKADFTSIVFHDVLSNEHAGANEELNY